MPETLPQLPASLSAERAVLGCILVDNALIHTAIETLQADEFYYPKHRAIYEAMLALNQAREPIDFQTLQTELARAQQLEAIGGMGAVLEITEEQYYTNNFSSYLRIVKDHALQRALILVGEKITGMAREGGDRPQAVLEGAEEALLSLSQERTRIGLTPLSDTMQETLERISALSMNQGQITGIPMGFRDLDARLSGLHPSDLVLLAARPSMGKTALGLNIAFNAAKVRDKEGNHPYHVAIFSLEMSKIQLAQRLLAISSGVNLQKIISGDFQAKEEWDQLFQGIAELRDMNIYIDDTSSISVQEMRAKCRRLKMEKGLDLIVIDYLQLMSADSLRRSENRQQEITQISRGLKALAKEMDCPVFSLSQLSRKAESREGSRPLMSDMRESGAIEQDADVVMLLYREDYYDPDTERPNVTEVIIAKHRNGPTGTVELYFEKELTRFKDLSWAPDPTA